MLSCILLILWVCNLGIVALNAIIALTWTVLGEFLCILNVIQNDEAHPAYLIIICIATWWLSKRV